MPQRRQDCSWAAHLRSGQGTAPQQSSVRFGGSVSRSAAVEAALLREASLFHLRGGLLSG